MAALDGERYADRGEGMGRSTWGEDYGCSRQDRRPGSNATTFSDSTPAASMGRCFNEASGTESWSMQTRVSTDQMQGPTASYPPRSEVSAANIARHKAIPSSLGDVSS